MKKDIKSKVNIYKSGNDYFIKVLNRYSDSAATREELEIIFKKLWEKIGCKSVTIC